MFLYCFSRSKHHLYTAYHCLSYQNCVALSHETPQVQNANQMTSGGNYASQREFGMSTSKMLLFF